MDNEKQQAEHLGSSDCSADGFPVCGDFLVRENKVSQENRHKRMRDALVRIMIWAEHDAVSGETRRKAMADIAKACHEGLED
jgi:hypothetical protein